MKRLLPILLLCALLLSGCDSAGFPNSADGTVLLRGDFARRGNTVFFAVNETLWRMGLDGSNRQKVADGCQSIADVTDRELYYYGMGEIVRVGWDGAGKTVLADDAYGLAGSTETWIYYTDYDETALVRVSRDGQRKEYFKGLKSWGLLADSTSAVITTSDALYYLSDDMAQPEKLMDGHTGYLCRWGDDVFGVTKNSIVKINLLDKTITTIFPEHALHLQTDGERVYFTGPDGNLRSIKTDGTDPVQLSEGGYSQGPGKPMAGYTVEDGWVYYQNKGRLLYRVSVDGKKSQQLTKTTIGRVSVADGKITYVNAEYQQLLDDVTSVMLEGTIHRMNADGSGDRAMELPDKSLQTYEFLVIGNYLYLPRITEMEQKLYRVQKDGQGQEEASSEPSDSRLYLQSIQYNGMRFYTKEDVLGIYCSQKDGSGEFQLCPQYGWEYAFEDGWLYLRNHEGVWRASPDAPGEAQCLVSSSDVADFALSGHRVIYELSGSGRIIQSINTDGSGPLALVNDENTQLIGTDSEWVFYSLRIYSENDTQLELRRIRPDGTGDSLLHSGKGVDMRNPTLAGGWIYYCNDKTPGRFRRVNCQTGEVQLVNKHHAFDIQSDSSYVYYKDIPNGIWRVPISGGEAQLVVAEPVNSYRLAGDWLYYQQLGRAEDLAVVRFR